MSHAYVSSHVVMYHWLANHVYSFFHMVKNHARAFSHGVMSHAYVSSHVVMYHSHVFSHETLARVFSHSKENPVSVFPLLVSLSYHTLHFLASPIFHHTCHHVFFHLVMVPAFCLSLSVVGLVAVISCPSLYDCC